jgi:hypothetical protein
MRLRRETLIRRTWLLVTVAVFAWLTLTPLVRYEDGERFNYWGLWALVFSRGSVVGTPADTAMVLVPLGIQFVLMALVAGAGMQFLIRGIRWWIRGARTEHDEWAKRALCKGIDFSDLPKFPGDGLGG